MLDQSILKASADDKIDLIQESKFVLEIAENIVGKEENAGYLFPQCFQKLSSSVLLKLGIV